VPLSGNFTGSGGPDDLCVWYPDLGCWRVATSNGTSFQDAGVWLTGWAVGDGWVPLVGDFDGDGRDDLCVWHPATGSWQVARSTGTSFQPAGVWLSNWAVGAGWVPRVGDFNGVGRDDVCVWHPATGNWQVALSTGSAFQPAGVWLSNWAVGTGWVPLVGNFNGTGPDDLCVWYPATGNWQVALSTGSAFQPTGVWLSNWAVGTNWVPLVGDFDGNGRDDLCVWYRGTGNWQVALSTGAGFQASGVWLANWAAGTGWIG
jgi:hypothetical protein